MHDLTADSLESRCSAHASVAERGRFADGTLFGDWRLTAFIGRGGNGEVYCAEHTQLDFFRDEASARLNGLSGK